MVQLSEELFEALQFVGKGIAFSNGSDVNIKLIFGDIDSNPDGDDFGRCCDGIHPVLQMRTRVINVVTVLAAVRAGTKGAAAILLRDGVLSTRTRSIYRAP